MADRINSVSGQIKLRQDSNQYLITFGRHGVSRTAQREIAGEKGRDKKREREIEEYVI